MFTRIENLSDLITWLECLKEIQKLPANQKEAAGIGIAQEILSNSGFPEGPYKQCCKCMNIWPETKEYFDWTGQGRTGLRAICKHCRKKYQKTYNKKKRAIKNLHGYSCQSDLEEINRMRKLEGQSPLPTEMRKPGRPKKSVVNIQQPPAPGELY
jgi:hypothetical protein